MKLIVTSAVNIASANIKKVLVEKYPFTETDTSFENNPIYQYKDYHLITSQKNVLELDYVKEHFQPEIYIICSTHASKVHNKTISVHATGNWGPAEMGGKEKELGIAPAGFLHHCFARIKKGVEERNIPYDPTYEVTHHGPSKMNAPLAFLEVGSSEEEWNDRKAIEVAADAVFSATKTEKPIAFGIGGTHYAPKFTKVADQYAVGHMCPKYAVEFLTQEMFIKAIEQTAPSATVVIIDWKGLKGEDRQRVIGYAEQGGIEVIRI